MDTLPVAFIQNLGAPELLVILVVVFLLFGAKKLPDLARSLGRSMGEFKKGREDGEKLANDKIAEVLKAPADQAAATEDKPKA